MVKNLLIIFGLVIFSVSGLSAQVDSVEAVDTLEAPEEAEPGMVKLIVIDAVIGPIVVQQIEKGIKKSIQSNAEALIILLNTPGGLSESTWKITTAIMNAEIPVVVYIYPQGARAASAGVFITYSAHIAAMAPATNMGSASAVSMQGEIDSTMYKKVTNDMVANMRAVARKRGRNEDWVERAIREAIAISDYEAVDSNVVDLVAKDIDDLLEKIHGREVELTMKTVTLNTKGARRETIPKTFSEKILEIISNPSIAFLLFSLGSLGLVLELYNPGAILPGVVGGICIILAFFSFQTLPVNYAGLLLILFSIVLFLLEIKVPSYGMLTIGGIVSLALGGVMLIDSPEPYLRVSWYVIAAVVIVFVGFFTLAIRFVVKAHRKQVSTGGEGLIGQIGRVTQKIDQYGTVMVSGELWKAKADEPIEKDAMVKVVKQDGMVIKVENFKEDIGG